METCVVAGCLRCIEGQRRSMAVAATPRQRTRATATTPTQTPALKIPSMAAHPVAAIARLVPMASGAFLLIRWIIGNC